MSHQSGEEWLRTVLQWPWDLGEWCLEDIYNPYFFRRLKFYIHIFPDLTAHNRLIADRAQQYQYMSRKEWAPNGSYIWYRFDELVRASLAIKEITGMALADCYRPPGAHKRTGDLSKGKMEVYVLNQECLDWMDEAVKKLSGIEFDTDMLFDIGDWFYPEYLVIRKYNGDLYRFPEKLLEKAINGTIKFMEFVIKHDIHVINWMITGVENLPLTR